MPPHRAATKFSEMSATQQKLYSIAEQLSETKLSQLVDYASYLQGLSEEGDREWERLIAHPQPRPKLDRFINDAMTEQPSEPMDLRRL